MNNDLDRSEADASDTGGSQGGVNVFRVIWHHKALILLGVVLGGIGGAIYYSRCSPVYMSFAQVLVVKQRPDFTVGQSADGSSSTADDVVASHLVLIRSPMMVRDAVVLGDLKKLPSLQAAEDPAATIIGGLSVSRDLQGSVTSNILNLGYRGSAPDDCAKVLLGVIESYKQFLNVTYNKNTDDTLQLITQAKEILAKDLQQKEKEYVEFRKHSTLHWQGKQGVNLHQEMINSIQESRSKLMIKRAEIKGRLEALETAIKNSTNKDELIAMIAKPGSQMAAEKMKNPTFAKDENSLMDLLIQEQMLLNDFGKDHPQVQSVRKRLEVIKEYVSKPPALITSLRKDGDDKVKTHEQQVETLIQDHLLSLRRELKEHDVLDDTLKGLYVEQHADAKKLTNEEIEDETRRGDITRTQALFESVLKRLQEVRLIKELGNTFDVRLISPPGSGWRVEPRATPIFGIALFAGLACGIGLAYLAELSDKSFRSPQEIRRRLGMPVIGHVPVLKRRAMTPTPADSKLDPMLLTHHKPRSVEAEAYRAVRTSLYFSTNGNHKVIQVTSPNMGDGKTTLATNLAVSIAQSGKRVVLMDADFRRPRIHKIFGVPATTGVASVIAGTADLDEATQASGVPNLSLLPCGPTPKNPAELLTSPEFQELLDVLRDKYDFVIVDTPPLLLVTDPCAVAPRVDGVLLTIRVSKNGRPQAERAKEILTTLGARVLGVVVNGVGRSDGRGGYGYGFEPYKYGYGFGYGDKYGSSTGYGYGYGYDYRYGGYYAADGGSEAKGNGHPAGDGPANGAALAVAEQTAEADKPGLLRRMLGK